MKDQLKQWIPIVLFVVTLCGWFYDNGRKSAKIEMLKLEIENIKSNDNEQNEFIKEQLTFNSRTATILELISK